MKEVGLVEETPDNALSFLTLAQFRNYTEPPESRTIVSRAD